MLLSVSMIVKNEAAGIARCLDSVKLIADEIVIVDTGSSDNTRDICRLCTPHVYDSAQFSADTPPDRFHFADARNEALRHCRGEWVLSIDADEVLTEFGLRTFLRDCSAKSCLLTLTTKRHTAFVPRLFRRDGVTWVGRYHDTPSPWDHAGAVAVPPDVARLANYGVDEEVKLRRNLALLKRQMIEDGRLTDTVVQIADTYRALGVSMFPEAIGHYEMYLPLIRGGNAEFEPYILFALADCYGRLGVGSRAIELGQELIRRFPKYERGWLVLAEMYQRLRQYDLAISYYQRALKVSDPMPVHPFFDEPIRRDVVEHRIMLCDLELRQAEEVCV